MAHGGTSQSGPRRSSLACSRQNADAYLEADSRRIAEGVRVRWRPRTRRARRAATIAERITDADRVVPLFFYRSLSFSCIFAPPPASLQSPLVSSASASAEPRLTHAFPNGASDTLFRFTRLQRAPRTPPSAAHRVPVSVRLGLHCGDASAPRTPAGMPASCPLDLDRPALAPQSPPALRRSSSVASRASPR